MTNYTTDGKLGVAIGRVDDDPAFSLGQQATGDDGSLWNYCKLGTGGVTGLGYVLIIDEDWLAVMASLTTSASAFGQRMGVWPSSDAGAENQYGWVQTGGVCDAIQVLASAAANVALNTTATDGALDDDGTAGSENASGIVLTTAKSAAQGNAPGVIFNPVVGATN